MTSSLEQLPPEMLEQIVTPVHRSARRVSRTLRAATQRRLEQLCQQPISIVEITQYFGLEPMAVAMFPAIERIIQTVAKFHEAEELQPDLQIEINTFYYRNRGYENYYIYISRFEDFTGTSDSIQLIEDNPESEGILKTLDPVEMPDFSTRLTLDLLSQWRILTARAGCTEIKTITRNYLIAGLTQLRQLIDEVSQEWLALDNDEAVLDAFYVLMYFQVYLFVNAEILNVWPLNRRESLTWHLEIENVFNPNELEQRNRLLHSINDLYGRVIQAIQDLR